MTIEELEEVLQTLRDIGGDWAHIEAKRSEHGLPRRLWETLSAFANTPGGGVIVLGLDEETGFRVVGVRDPARLQSDLASLCDMAGRITPYHQSCHQSYHQSNHQSLTPLAQSNIMQGPSFPPARLPNVFVQPSSPCAAPNLERRASWQPRSNASKIMS